VTKNYTVSATDCIYSIAFENGFLPETIWNDPKNAELKKSRQNNILQEGDVVFVPDPRLKITSGASDRKHSFVLKSVPAKIAFKVLRVGKPIGNASYTLTIDGVTTRGTTDGDGTLHAPILPNAKLGRLIVDDAGEKLTYELELGRLDPGTEISGFQQRLVNLGYDISPDEYGSLGSGTRRATALFQIDRGLVATGDGDEATKAKVIEAYGF
jgi:hypothetical protein